MQFGQIHFSIWTNTFFNLDKYISQFGEIHFSFLYSVCLLLVPITVIDCKPTASSVFFWKSASEDNLQLLSACYQMFNILYIRITLYNKESAKIILDCLRIKSIAQSSCYYCLLQLLILLILQIFLQLLVILLILLSLLILLLLLPPQHWLQLFLTTVSDYCLLDTDY